MTFWGPDIVWPQLLQPYPGSISPHTSTSYPTGAHLEPVTIQTGRARASSRAGPGNAGAHLLWLQNVGVRRGGPGRAGDSPGRARSLLTT